MVWFFMWIQDSSFLPNLDWATLFERYKSHRRILLNLHIIVFIFIIRRHYFIAGNSIMSFKVGLYKSREKWNKTKQIILLIDFISKKNSMVIRWHLTYELYVFRQMFSDKYSLFLNLNSRVAIVSFVAFHLCSALCMRKHFFSEYSIFMWNNVYIGVVYFSKLCENKWTICVEE